MAWEILSRRVGGRGDPEKISMSYGHSLIIAFGGDVAKSLGWKAGDRVALIFGTEADAGKLRVVSDRNGQYTLSKLSQNTPTLKAQRHGLPGVKREKHPRTLVDFERIENGVEIELPDWAQPSGAGDPQKTYPRKPAAAVQQPPAPSVKPGNRDLITTDQKLGPLLPHPATRRCSDCGSVFKTNIVKRLACAAHP